MNQYAEWTVYAMEPDRKSSTVRSRYVRTTESAYVFYDTQFESPVAVYPIRHFYVRKQSD